MRWRTGRTDRIAVLRLYDILLAMRPTPVVAINRAVALSRAHSPEEGLAALDALDAERLADFLPFHAARADLLATMLQPVRTATRSAKASRAVRTGVSGRTSSSALASVARATT